MCNEPVNMNSICADGEDYISLLSDSLICYATVSQSWYMTKGGLGILPIPVCRNANFMSSFVVGQFFFFKKIWKNETICVYLGCVFLMLFLKWIHLKYSLNKNQLWCVLHMQCIAQLKCLSFRELKCKSTWGVPQIPEEDPRGRESEGEGASLWTVRLQIYYTFHFETQGLFLLSEFQPTSKGDLWSQKRDEIMEQE